MDIRKILGGTDQYAQSKVERGESGDAAAKIAAAKAKAKAGEASSDRVSLSDDSRLVAQAVQDAQEAPDIRVDWVEALKAQVQAGTYDPDPRKIAEKLVDSELDFLR